MRKLISSLAQKGVKGKQSTQASENMTVTDEILASWTKFSFLYVFLTNVSISEEFCEFRDFISFNINFRVIIHKLDKEDYSKYAESIIRP